MPNVLSSIPCCAEEPVHPEHPKPLAIFRTLQAAPVMKAASAAPWLQPCPSAVAHATLNPPSTAHFPNSRTFLSHHSTGGLDAFFSASSKANADADSSPRTSHSLRRAARPSAIFTSVISGPSSVFSFSCWCRYSKVRLSACSWRAGRNVAMPRLRAISVYSAGRRKVARIERAGAKLDGKGKE